MVTANQVFRDYETDGVPSSGAHEVKKADVRELLTGFETIINAFLSNGGLIYSSKASLDADLAHGPNSMAWVIGDSTVSNNGIYRKIGASGTGSWTRVADLPFSFIIASDTGAGTPNAIQATTSIPVSSSALVWMNVFEANTASPVTVSFNGGSALTIKTNSGNDVVAGGLTAGMIVMGIVSGSTFRLVSDQASAAIVAAAEAAAAAAQAAASSIATYATRDVAAAQDLSGVSDVTISRWSSSSLYAPATYKKVSSEPAHAAKFQSADGTWWEISQATLNSAMLGLLGDYDPDTRTGTDETAAIDQAFAISVAIDRDLHMWDGVYYHLGELNYPAGLRVFGTHRRRCQFYLEIDNTQAGGRIEAQNVHIEDIGHLIYLTVGLGPDDGEYGSGWTLGRYYTDGEPIQTSNVTALRIGCYVAPSSPFGAAHGWSGLGRISGAYVDDLEVEGFAGAAVHFHWGANAVGVDLPIVATYHPNDIRVRNLKAVDCGRPFTFSACFNVSVVGIAGTCDRFGDIIPGDETNFYSVVEERSLVGSAIRISDFDINGLIDVSGLGSLRLTSIGTSRADDDVETGLGTRRILEWKKVVIENGKLKGADNVARCLDLTSAVGDIVIRNVDTKEVARAGTGLRLADTRGNILVDNVSVANALGVEWLRAWGVRCVNMDIDMVDRSGLVGDLIGVSVDGTEFTATLSANKLTGATSISLTAALGANLNPGDTIIVDGNHVKVAGTRQIRSTETIIPIEAASWTASSGATVYCDQRSIVKLQHNRLDSYDFGVSMSDCHQLDICGNDFIDIAKQGATGVAKSGVIARNKFIRGGQHRLTDGAYASRNIILSAGSENIAVRDNELGIDADYIDTCIQTSSDTGNLRIKDNAFGNAITAHVSLATQSNARLDASQFNEFAGNYRKDGGQLTGPGTWYEILQNGIVRYHGTAAPTRGFHRAGSEWVHTTPAVGQPIGGMCTASGTAGTWVNKANL